MNYRLQTYVGTMMGIHGGNAVSQEAVEPIRWTPLLDSGYEILIEDGQERGRTIPLEAAVLLVGREEVPGEKRAGWLLFADRSVSRRQALLWWDAHQQTYHLMHVDSATNLTLVNHEPKKTAELPSGEHVKAGHLGFRVHRRPLVRPNNPVVRSAMGLVGDVRDAENWIDTGGLALTVVEGDGQGQTFLLNKSYHLIGARSRTRTSSVGGNIAMADPVLSAEQAVLIWVESARCYAIVHHRLANAPTWISHAGSDPRTFPDPYEDPVILNPDHPLYIRAGDIVGVGNLKLLVHEEIGPIIESAVNGLLRGEWPTWAGGFSPPVEKAAPPPSAPKAEPYVEPPSETIRWTPSAEWFVQISMGAQQLPEIPIMSSTLTNGRIFSIGGPGGSASDIQLDDKNLPDSVARLEYQNGTWVIMPDTSMLPVYVGAQQLRDRRYVQAADEVVIGRYRLRLAHRTQPASSGPPPPRFALDILSAPGWSGGGRLNLDKGEVTLGRDKGCELVFNDATVSRRHASVMVANGRVWLRPLSTTNPTFVNGVQVQQSRALDHGDEIQLSRDSSVRFVDLKEEVF